MLVAAVAVTGMEKQKEEDGKTPSEECARELEAIGKFSQAAVSLSLRLSFSLFFSFSPTI